MRTLAQLLFVAVMIVFAGGIHADQLVDTSGEPVRYPSYNTLPLQPDSAGMESNVVEIASKITLGLEHRKHARSNRG